MFGYFAIASSSTGDKKETIPFSDVITRANSGEIKSIEIQTNELLVTPKGEGAQTFKSMKEFGGNKDFTVENSETKDQDFTKKMVLNCFDNSYKIFSN